MTEKTKPAFEAECSSVDEFLRMLELRESEETPNASYQIEERSALRRSVFVCQLQDYRSTPYGLPQVSRYVTGGFAYGEDLVSMKVYTSRGIEMPQGPESGKPAERQSEVYEEIREKIRARIADSVLDVPVVEGFLHHAIDPRSGDAA